MKKALRVVMLCPWPTMILERIGIIGNTHGVNASNKPKPKKVRMINRVLPLASEAAI